MSASIKWGREASTLLVGQYKKAPGLMSSTRPPALMNQDSCDGMHTMEVLRAWQPLSHSHTTLHHTTYVYLLMLRVSLSQSLNQRIVFMNGGLLTIQ